MDLISETGEAFNLSNSGWTLCLQVAEEHGWTPSGTYPPDDYREPLNWTGGYQSNDGQWISAFDARSLSDALKESLNDSARATKAAHSVLPPAVATTLCWISDPPSSVINADHLQRVIAFLRLGAFQIW